MEKLRTSSYVIPIELEAEPDKYMLIHGYTGAIDIVDGNIADLLSYDIVDIEQAQLPAELTEKFLRRGYLTTKSSEEESEYVRRLAVALHKK